MPSWATNATRATGRCGTLTWWSSRSPGAPANGQGAHALAEFVLSPEGRAVIGAFGVKTSGEPLFTPERR